MSLDVIRLVITSFNKLGVISAWTALEACLLRSSYEFSFARFKCKEVEFLDENSSMIQTRVWPQP